MRFRRALLVVAMLAAGSTLTFAPTARAAVINEAYRVTTPDGVIYGEVLRPASGGRVPVILTYSPYNHQREPDLADGGVGEDLLLARDGVADFFVPKGYARAVFSVVGTHSSTGCFDYGGPRERRTGAAVIEHLARQPWSNGRVGMIGLSYDGSTTIGTAVEAPPHLFAIVAQAAVSRRYDHIYVNGVHTHSPEPMFDDFSSGAAGSTEPEGWAARVRPCDRVLNTQESTAPDPVFGAYWSARDDRARASGIRAAVMLEAGWLDGTVRAHNSTQLFRVLPAQIPKRMVVGQWGHDDSALETAQAERLAWFDTWLKGIDRGVQREPAVRSLTFDGRTHASPTWPPPGVREITIPLGSGTRRWTDADRSLNEGIWLAMPYGTHPGFVRIDLTSIDEDVRILGGAVELALTSTQPETHIGAFLYAARTSEPDMGITRGYLNTRNRAGLHKSDSVTPGEPYSVTVPLLDTDVPARAGRGISLLLASTNQYEVLSDDAPPSENTVDLSRSFLRLLVVAD